MIVENKPNTSSWNLEDGYSRAGKKSVYPYRAFSFRISRFTAQITVSDGEHDNLCQNDIAGVKVFLNIPGEIPSTLQSVKAYTQSSFLQSVTTYITPYLIKAADGLRKYAPNTRKCYFASERRLRFFKLYTKNNCELECLATFIKQECDCVKLSMPSKFIAFCHVSFDEFAFDFVGDNKTSICGAASIPCYQSAQRKLFDDHEIDNMQDQQARIFRQNCNCLDSCTSIVYNTQTYQSA